ncbi:hypothetical protein Fcan01_15678 [Folsomia candida]|uniref:Gustatory receptor n=1 Tax=Folsomia candida TaxID=158441 RepID=A0A226DUX0_FOLCA|nr:hypothetical protein Fcan01_15678 [Folsomia candida]
MKNSNKSRRTFLYFLIILHLMVILKWLLDQWLYPVNPPPETWKFVLMYYCLILFVTSVVIVAKYTIHNNETIFLLNSALQIEQDVMVQGSDVAQLYYIGLNAISTASVVLMPINCCVFALRQPCMPPVVTSAIYLESSIMCAGTFTVTVVLTYPSQVKVILLGSMNRDLNTGGPHVSSCLRKYRILELLVDMHNLVLKQPVMSALVGCVTTLESFTLYIVIASRSVVPLPLLLLFAAVAVSMFFVIVRLFKMMSNPFIKSVELLNSLKRMNESKQIKRCVQSFREAKLTLGDGKFFDTSTSLVIWAKCIDLLITFLLT